MSLLDYIQSAGQQAGNLLQQLPQAIAGPAPQVDPNLQQLISPEQMQGIQQNRQQNFWNNFAQASGNGQGLFGALGAAGNSANGQFNQGIASAINDANALRSNRQAQGQQQAFQQLLADPNLDPQTKQLLHLGGPQAAQHLLEQQALAKQQEAARQALMKPQFIGGDNPNLKSIIRANQDGTVTALPNPNYNAALADPESGVKWTQQDIDLAGDRYAETGTLPPLGMGKAGLAVRQQILHSAAQVQVGARPPVMDANGNPAASNSLAAASTNKSSAAAMAAQTKTAAIMDSSEQTVLKNLGVVQSYMDKAGQAGSPLINSLQNAVRTKALGDGDVSAYRLALTTTRDEYARVISMATGAQGITDAARVEASNLFPDTLSPDMFAKNVEVAKAEMGNRTSSLHAQIAQQRAVIGRGNYNQAQPAAAPPPPSAAAPQQPVVHFNYVPGKGLVPTGQ